MTKTVQKIINGEPWTLTIGDPILCTECGSDDWDMRADKSIFCSKCGNRYEPSPGAKVIGQTTVGQG